MIYTLISLSYLIYVVIIVSFSQNGSHDNIVVYFGNSISNISELSNKVLSLNLIVNSAGAPN